MTHTQQELNTHAKRIIEALLFSAQSPLTTEQICAALRDFYPYTPLQTAELLEELREEYSRDRSALQLDELGEGHILRTKAIYRPYLEKMLGTKRPEKLSQASLETLAIIAYKQPVPRVAIETIRGVDCSNVIHNLLEKGLIEQVGRSSLPGKAPTYGVTQQFLVHFSLKGIEELPKWQEMQKLTGF